MMMHGLTNFKFTAQCFSVTTFKLYNKLLRTQQCSVECYVQLFIAFVGQ